MPPLSNKDNAITEAAKLALDHAWRRVFDEQATASSISLELVPLFGISWSRDNILAVDQRQNNRRINQLLARVGNSTQPRAEYDLLDDLFKSAYFAPGDSPPEWGEWRTIADRYRLDRRHSWSTLASVGSQLIAAGFPSPLELAAAEPDALEVIVPALEDRRPARDFWRGARLDSSRDASADSFLLDQQNFDVQAFQRAVKRHLADLAQRNPVSGTG